ncbi:MULTISPECIES: hypothetical protein [unclassified Microcoleus]|uniref:hypothetical protein n=1 Tax=unclassified Microcoleus TaxID=2642155 RepID=UPI0025CC3647|nr:MULTISPECIES: hypothetical protein [unclassified Microcoleus]
MTKPYSLWRFSESVSHADEESGALGLKNSSRQLRAYRLIQRTRAIVFVGVAPVGAGFANGKS